MSRIAHGTQVSPTVVVLQGDATQMRKLRCPACQGNAATQKSPQGKDVVVCLTCGRTFTSVRM